MSTAHMLTGASVRDDVPDASQAPPEGDATPPEGATPVDAPAPVGAPAPVDRPTWLRVAILRTAALATLASGATMAGSPHLTSSWLPAGVRGVTLGLVGLPAAWVVVEAVRGASSLRSAHWLIAGAAVANVAAAAGPHAGPDPGGTPYLASSTLIASGLALSVLRSRTSAIGAVVGLALGYAWLRSPAMGLPVALLETSVTVVASASVGMYVRLLAGAYRRLGDVLADRQRVARATAAHTEAGRIQDEWDRLVHDKVLGALTIAARTASLESLRTARELAGDALRALGVIEGGWRDPRDLGRLARDLGLDVRGQVLLPLGLPDDVVTALRAAASEALVNVARHAGVPEVGIRVEGGHRAVVVTIADRGQGFERQAIVGRMGVTRSIPGHMGQVGGTASVVSAPGQGTTVRLAWSSTPAASLAPERPVEPGSNEDALATSWPWVAALVATWLVLHLALGWLSTRGLWSHALVLGWPQSVWLSAACLVAGLAVGAMRRGAPFAVAVVPAAVGALASLTPPPPRSDGSLWFVDASLVLGVALVVHHRIRWAWAYAVLTPLALLAGLATHDGRAVSTVPDVLVHPLVTTTLLVVAIRALDAARHDLRSGTAVLGHLRRAAEVAQMRAEARRAQRAELSRDVIPILERLWSGEPFTDADRREAELAEPATRDRLVAADLLSEELVETTTAARRRGATVVLRASSLIEDGGPHLPFTRAVTVLMATAGADSTVTVHWHPADRHAAGTAVVSAPTGRVDPAAISLALGGSDYELEELDDEVWMRVLPTPGVSPVLGTPPEDRPRPRDLAATVEG